MKPSSCESLNKVSLRDRNKVAERRKEGRKEEKEREKDKKVNYFLILISKAKHFQFTNLSA